MSSQTFDPDSHTEFYARMQTPTRPSPPRLIETQWPDGPIMYFSGQNDQLLRTAQKDGAMPYYERGVVTRLVPDDGTKRWENQ